MYLKKKYGARGSGIFENYLTEFFGFQFTCAWQYCVKSPENKIPDEGKKRANRHIH